MYYIRLEFAGTVLSLINSDPFILASFYLFMPLGTSNMQNNAKYEMQKRPFDTFCCPT